MQIPGMDSTIRLVASSFVVDAEDSARSAVVLLLVVPPFDHLSSFTFDRSFLYNLFLYEERLIKR